MPVMSNLGDPKRTETLAQAIALLEAQPPGPELVAAYGELAGLHVVFLSDYPGQSRPRNGRSGSRRSFGCPSRHGATGVGVARAALGDAGGLDDLRRALALSIERGKGRDAGSSTNLSEALSYYEGPRRRSRSPARGSSSRDDVASRL